jgi:hypothetical protein
MTTAELTAILDQTTKALQEYLTASPGGFSPQGTPALQATAEHLQRGLYLLLPPRGSSTPTCPHCGKSVTVTLS